MNPFKYGQVVQSNDFCPRPDLLEQICEFMISGQNILIKGERRVGKTSLIFESVKAYAKKRILYVDLLEIKTSDDFCRRLVKAIISMEQKSGFLEKIFRSLSQLKPLLSADPLTGQPTISLDPIVRLKPESIEELLDLILKMNEQKPIVVVFDEFQDILNLKDSKETLAILRSKIQFHTMIPYIFAGSIRNKMDSIFNSPESAFFKSAISIEVGSLDKELFVSFLMNKFKLGKRSAHSSLFDTIFEIAENNSGDVQQLCEALWETTSYGDKIIDKNIPNSLKLIFARELKGYEATLVQLTAQQVKCLVGLAKIGGKEPQSALFLHKSGIALPASVKKALTRLEQLKIIFHSQKEYKFINPFFKAWLIFKNY